MKTYEITPVFPEFPQRVRANSIGEAQAMLGLVTSEVKTWRVVPTFAQIRKTKSLMRGL